MAETATKALCWLLCLRTSIPCPPPPHLQADGRLLAAHGGKHGDAGDVDGHAVLNKACRHWVYSMAWRGRWLLSRGCISHILGEVHPRPVPCAGTPASFSIARRGHSTPQGGKDPHPAASPARPTHAQPKKIACSRSHSLATYCSNIVVRVACPTPYREQPCPTPPLHRQLQQRPQNSSRSPASSPTYSAVPSAPPRAQVTLPSPDPGPHLTRRCGATPTPSLPRSGPRRTPTPPLTLLLSPQLQQRHVLRVEAEGRQRVARKGAPRTAVRVTTTLLRMPAAAAVRRLGLHGYRQLPGTTPRARHTRRRAQVTLHPGRACMTRGAAALWGATAGSRLVDLWAHGWQGHCRGSKDCPGGATT